MFSRPADNFRSRARLAISLSWVAGFTNVVMLIACYDTASHQTGNVTRFGELFGSVLLGYAPERRLKWYWLFLGCFLLGAMLSGVITEWTRRHRGRARYILPMIVEGILLSATLIELLLPFHYHAGATHSIAVCIACAAMGLQNATITKISGAVVRTTHLTGVMTDFGLETIALCLWWRDRLRNLRPARIGRAFRVMRRQTSAQRVALLGSIFGSFLFGATLGAILFAKLGPMALLGPILFLATLILTSRATPPGGFVQMAPRGFPVGPLDDPTDSATRAI